MALSSDDDAVRASRAALVFYACCRFIAVGASHFYFPGKVFGAEHLPATGAYVLAPIHRSYVDWLIVARVTRRRLCYLVKGEVWKFKPVGWLLEALGAFPVRRGAADREALNNALEVLERGEPLVVFPEGTRRFGQEVVDLREGASYLALRANVPIIPVGIGGGEKVMRRGARIPRPGRITVVVGEPIDPALFRSDPDSARISRSAARQLTAALATRLEMLFGEATTRLTSGTPTN